MNDNFDKYLKSTIWKSQERLDHVLKLLFRGFDIRDKTILEIGAGSGVLSAWCALNGARETVAIEPEADGSTAGVKLEFKKMAEIIDLGTKVSYMPITFEKYLCENKSKTFDYLLMHAVINHLNEAAVQKLHLNSANSERQSYINIFKSIGTVLKQDGVLIAYDVGRRNFWNDIGLKTHLTKNLEYAKHQQPIVWKNLLEQSGFELIDIRWMVPVKLKIFAPLLYWWLPAYLTQSGFILRCKKVRSF